jgi:hypothetical protein
MTDDDSRRTTKGSAFVTLHGSWEPAATDGYKVVRLLFDGNGQATGEYEDFMTGFVVSDKTVWGRPSESRSRRTAPLRAPRTAAGRSGASRTREALPGGRISCG